MNFAGALLLTLAIASVAAQDVPFSTENIGGAGTSGKRYTPGYVSATMADAFADALRMKAAYKYQPKEQISAEAISPTPTGKSKSKDFTFTNIRLQTSATGGEIDTAAAANVASAMAASAGTGGDKKSQLLASLLGGAKAAEQPPATVASTPVATSGAREQTAFTTENVAAGRRLFGNYGPLLSMAPKVVVVAGSNRRMMQE